MEFSPCVILRVFCNWLPQTHIRGVFQNRSYELSVGVMKRGYIHRGYTRGIGGIQGLVFRAGGFSKGGGGVRKRCRETWGVYEVGFHLRSLQRSVLTTLNPKPYTYMYIYIYISP